MPEGPLRRKPTPFDDPRPAKPLGPAVRVEDAFGTVWRVLDRIAAGRGQAPYQAQGIVDPGVYATILARVFVRGDGVAFEAAVADPLWVGAPPDLGCRSLLRQLTLARLTGPC